MPETVEVGATTDIDFRHHSINSQSDLSDMRHELAESQGISDEFRGDVQNVIDEEIINAIFRGNDSEVYTKVENNTVILRSKSIVEHYATIAKKLLSANPASQREKMAEIHKRLENGDLSALDEISESGRGSSMMLELTQQIVISPEEISFHFDEKHSRYPEGKVVITTAGGNVISMDENRKIVETFDDQQRAITLDEAMRLIEAQA